MQAHYRLLRMTPADAPETIRWITNQYGFDPEEVRQWVHHLHFNWPLSVKAINPDGHTIGLLNMSDYRIEAHPPQLRHDYVHLARPAAIRLRFHSGDASFKNPPLLAKMGCPRILPRQLLHLLHAPPLAPSQRFNLSIAHSPSISPIRFGLTIYPIVIYPCKDTKNNQFGELLC